MALGDLIPWIAGGIILVILGGLVLYFVGIYNRFFSLKNSSEATLGQIRVAMKKRLDMIDQLLGAVKSYATFERETLEKVTAMRTRVATADPGDLNSIEKESRSLLGRLFAVAEAYPDLKTNTTVFDPHGFGPGSRGRDCPTAVYLQQHIAAIQHPLRRDTLQFRCPHPGAVKTPVPGI